jgi:hypothetical protein
MRKTIAGLALLVALGCAGKTPDPGPLQPDKAGQHDLTFLESKLVGATTDAVRRALGDPRSLNPATKTVPEVWEYRDATGSFFVVFDGERERVGRITRTFWPYSGIHPKKDPTVPSFR